MIILIVTACVKSVYQENLTKCSKIKLFIPRSQKKKTAALFLFHKVNHCNFIEIKRQPDIDSDHVLPVGLLHHVVDGIAANKRDVDVVPGYNL